MLWAVKKKKLVGQIGLTVWTQGPHCADQPLLHLIKASQ